MRHRRQDRHGEKLNQKIKSFARKPSLTQNQAVLPRKNINNLGPSIASPHPDSIKGKISKKIYKFIQKFRTQQNYPISRHFCPQKAIHITKRLQRFPNRIISNGRPIPQHGLQTSPFDNFHTHITRQSQIAALTNPGMYILPREHKGTSLYGKRLHSH